MKFFLWETSNILMVLLSWFLTHWLLNKKFTSYGYEVIDFIGSEKLIETQYFTHDPQCELFPTEVACTFRIGASTGGIDRSNFLCILGNNLFNQKYFLFLWMWWILLLTVSFIGVIYRLAWMLIPGFSRERLLRKVHAKGVDNFQLYRFNSSDCFVLDLLLDNMSCPRMKVQVLEQIDKLETENEEAREEVKGKKTWMNLDTVDSVRKPYSESCHVSEVSLTESDTIVHMNNTNLREGNTPNGRVQHGGNAPNGHVKQGAYPTLPSSPTNV